MPEVIPYRFSQNCANQHITALLCSADKAMTCRTGIAGLSSEEVVVYPKELVGAFYKDAPSLSGINILCPRIDYFLYQRILKRCLHHFRKIKSSYVLAGAR